MVQRTVVVTAGGTGIGRASAEWFARAGDRVIIAGRREPVLREAASAIGARAVVADLSEPSGARALAEAIDGEIGVLVNNAGGNPDLQGTPVPAGLDGVRAAWQRNFDANVLTAVLATEALRERIADHGRVITIGSIAARSGAASCGAAKAAVEAWNLSLGGELGPRGITCNVVSPGLIIDTEFFNGQLSDERKEMLISQTATNRAGVPDDVAETIGWLASPGAGHITKQVIHVDGGAYAGH